MNIKDWGRRQEAGAGPAHTLPPFPGHCGAWAQEKGQLGSFGGGPEGILHSPQRLHVTKC